MAQIKLGGHTIEAIQWTGQNRPEVLSFLGPEATRISQGDPGGRIGIPTPDGVREPAVRDWICRYENHLWVLPGCEVCGEPATGWVYDIIAREKPEKIYLEFEPDGPKHFYCNEHRRESHRTIIRPTLAEMLASGEES